MAYLAGYWGLLALIFIGLVALVDRANKAMSDAIHWSTEQRGWPN